MQLNMNDYLTKLIQKRNAESSAKYFDRLNKAIRFFDTSCLPMYLLNAPSCRNFFTSMVNYSDYSIFNLVKFNLLIITLVQL